VIATNVRGATAVICPAGSTWSAGSTFVFSGGLHRRGAGQLRISWAKAAQTSAAEATTAAVKRKMVAFIANSLRKRERSAPKHREHLAGVYRQRVYVAPAKRGIRPWSSRRVSDQATNIASP
jgi:hypothetical protein